MAESDYKYDNHYSNTYKADFKPINLFVGESADYDFDNLVAESEARIAATLKSGNEVILSPTDLAKIEEIRYLHDTALRRALKRDGHSKSNEGSLTIQLGNYWSRLDDDGETTIKPEVGVELYSYVLGPHRSHWFASIDRALETVRLWHAQEMSSPAEFEPWGEEDDETI